MRNSELRVKFDEAKRNILPIQETEKFFGDFLSRKSRPSGEDEKMQNCVGLGRKEVISTRPIRQFGLS